MLTDSPDEWQGDVEQVELPKWQPALMNLNFDATADLQDVVFDAENGEVGEGELLGHLRNAVALLQERESELLRVVLHGNELASALNTIHTSKPDDAKLRHDNSLLSRSNTELTNTIDTCFKKLTELLTATLPATPLPTTLPAIVNQAVDCVNNLHAQHTFQETAHKRLIATYEAKLTTSSSFLLKRPSEALKQMAVQTEDQEERSIEVKVLHDKSADLEKMLTVSQEQNLDDRATIETLKEQVDELRRQLDSNEDKEEKESVNYPTDRSDAVSEELERSMGHDPQEMLAEISKGHIAVLEADIKVLREQMARSKESAVALGDTIVALWGTNANLKLQLIQEMLHGTKHSQRAEHLVTKWEEEAERQEGLVVTSTGAKGPPSTSNIKEVIAAWKESDEGTDEQSEPLESTIIRLQEEVGNLKYTLNEVVDEKQELENELIDARCQVETLRCDGRQGLEGSAASSLITTSSKWTPAKAPAQPPFDAPLVAGVMGFSSPLNLHVAPSPLSTAPSSPEMNLRWASPRARPAFPREARNVHRMPMKVFELPPAPDKHRFSRKPGTSSGPRTREDDLLDALSIPQTDSFVFDSNMSPSDTSESFSPPMSPSGRRAFMRQLAGTTPSPSSAMPLSPLHCHKVPLMHRISTVSTVSTGMQTEPCCEGGMSHSDSVEESQPTGTIREPKKREHEDDDLQYSGEESDP